VPHKLYLGAPSGPALRSQSARFACGAGRISAQVLAQQARSTRAEKKDLCYMLQENNIAYNKQIFYNFASIINMP
jgi:hypothetical protein